MSMNQVTIIGNLAKEPQSKTFDDGNQVTNLTVATNFFLGEDKEEEVEFHRVVVRGKQAGPCNEYLTTGKQVSVQGRLKTRQYTPRDGGDPKYITEIIAERVQFLGKKSD